jgi:hypothetical protein
MTVMNKTASASAAFDDNLLGASADTALAALQQAGARADALVETWIKSGNAAAVATIAEHGTGSARKAARRGLNVLKARGITVAERPRVASLTGQRQQEQFEAWMLPPDAAGSLLLVVAARTRESRYRAALVFVNESFGVQRIDTAEVSQSQLRESLSKMAPSADFKPVKVAVEWARYRIESARKRHEERGAPLPLGFATAKTLLSPVPEQPPAHPFDDEGLELADDDARELAKNSIALHALPEFRGWLPPKSAVDELLAKVGEGFTAGEQPAPETLQARLDEEIRAATDRFFSPERRADLVRAMKDCALSVLGREGEVRALDVVATMKVVENAGLITDPPHEVGFLRGFFDKAISYLLAQGKGNLRIPVAARPDGAPAGSANEQGQGSPDATSAPAAEEATPA